MLPAIWPSAKGATTCTLENPWNLHYHLLALALAAPEIIRLCADTGGHLKDAVGVCANELADPQLAIFLCRILEPGSGQPGPMLRHLLNDELLPSESSTHHAPGSPVQADSSEEA
jgi:hypothetical protein